MSIASLALRSSNVTFEFCARENPADSSIQYMYEIGESGKRALEVLINSSGHFLTAQTWLDQNRSDFFQKLVALETKDTEKIQNCMEMNLSREDKEARLQVKAIQFNENLQKEKYGLLKKEEVGARSDNSSFLEEGESKTVEIRSTSRGADETSRYIAFKVTDQWDWSDVYLSSNYLLQGPLDGCRVEIKQELEGYSFLFNHLVPGEEDVSIERSYKEFITSPHRPPIQVGHAKGADSARPLVSPSMFTGGPTVEIRPRATSPWHPVNRDSSSK